MSPCPGSDLASRIVGCDGVVSSPKPPRSVMLDCTYKPSGHVLWPAGAFPPPMPRAASHGLPAGSQERLRERRGKQGMPNRNEQQHGSPRDVPPVGRPRGAIWRSLQADGVVWEGQVLLVGDDVDLAARMIVTHT